MTTKSRFAVPLDALDQVQVKVEEQIQVHAPEVQPVDAARWGGSLEPAYGDSGAGAGGGGGACDGGGE